MYFVYTHTMRPKPNSDHEGLRIMLNGFLSALQGGGGVGLEKGSLKVPTLMTSPRVQGFGVPLRAPFSGFL